MSKEKNHAQSSLSQTILETLLKNVPDLVFVKDTAGVYLECNEAFSKFVGIERTNIIGKTDYDLFSKDIADFFRHHDLKMIKKGTPKRNEEWVSYPDGTRVLLDTMKIPYRSLEAEEEGVLGISRNITASKKLEESELVSSQRYEAAIQSSKDGFWLVSAEGNILEVNEAYCSYSGYQREDILKMNINDLDVAETSDRIKTHIDETISNGFDIFETVHRRKDGSYWPVEVSTSFSPIQGGCFFAFIRDITDRKISEELMTLRSKLSEITYQNDLHLLLQEALDVAEHLTFSKIGFFHFVEDDEETISLQTWSTRTLKEMCYAKGEGLHYPVSQAGVWVECIHQRKPIIHNDYPSLEHKKGMPDGHPPLIRELTVPLFRNGKVVSVIGLGNKETEYTDQDVHVVKEISNLCFEYSERKRTEQQIQFMAYNDILTKLPNRQLFADRLSQSILHSTRSDETVAICYLDLDGFKPVNDTYGHDLGDELLVDFAQRLKNELREGDTLARLGGDEFALILNDLHNISDAEEIVQRLLNVASMPFDIKGHRLHVSASIGITCYPQDQSDADTLLRHADQAMYKAKDSGKNTFYLYSHVHNQKKIERENSLEEFKQALKDKQLILYYQPRIDLQSGELAGVEALVRWQHPEKGLLPPALFLPVIEGNPLEIELDEWVVKTAIDQHILWRNQGLIVPVSVNITPRHIQQVSFPIYLKNVLSRYPEGISKFLELEILETSAIGDTAVVSKIMNECAELGIRFSLDDFGTGYSSLTYFHRLPIEILKIDQNFVRHMLDSAEDQQIVEGVLRLADSINRPVVAEGIENKELGFMLNQLGCKYAQGYGIAKPMPADKLYEWSVKWKQDEFWQHIGDETNNLTSSYDLNVAIFTTKKWLKEVEGYFKKPNVSAPDFDEITCHFTEWYHGIGTSKYGNRQQFPFILAKYNVMYDLAEKLASKLQNNTLQDEDILELRKAANELIELLKKLDQ